MEGGFGTDPCEKLDTVTAITSAITGADSVGGAVKTQSGTIASLLRLPTLTDL